MGKSGFIRASGAALALSLAAPTPAQPPADLATGNGLLQVCTDTANTNFWRCMSYLEGVTRATQMMDAKDNRTFCFPDGVTKGQIKDIVVAYLQQNPADRHVASEALTAVALMRAFPCPKKSVK